MKNFHIFAVILFVFIIGTSFHYAYAGNVGTLQSQSNGTNDIFRGLNSGAVKEIYIDSSGNLLLASGLKITVNPSASTAGMNIGTLASNPTSPRQGDIWTASQVILYQDNGNRTETLVNLNATQTLSGKTLSSPTFSGTSLGTYTFAGTYNLGGTPTVTATSFNLSNKKLTTTNFIINETGTDGVGGVMLTNSLVNQATNLGIVPRGSSNQAILTLSRTADTATNYESLRLGTDLVGSNENAIQSFNGGSGTLRAINTYISSTLITKASTDPSFIVGTGSNRTLASTSGLFYVPVSDGTPTGVPTSFTGSVAMQYDGKTNKLYVYNGGWKAVTLS